MIPKGCMDIGNPLEQMKTLSNLRIHPPRLRQKKSHEQDIDHTEHSREPEWSGSGMRRGHDETSKYRTKNESDTESRTDQTEIPRPFMGFGNIRDTRLSDTEIGPGQTGNGPTHEKENERPDFDTETEKELGESENTDTERQ